MDSKLQLNGQKKVPTLILEHVLLVLITKSHAAIKDVITVTELDILRGTAEAKNVILAVEIRDLDHLQDVEGQTQEIEKINVVRHPFDHTAEIAEIVMITEAGVDLLAVTETDLQQIEETDQEVKEKK